MASEIKVDTISEKTSAGGVTIDGLLIKDGNISGDVALAGTTPTFTIGDAGAEDATLLFDGNAQDFHIGLDDTADDLVIGVGSTLGTTTAIAIDENTNTTFSGTVTVGVNDTGKDVKFFGATAGSYWLWDESADGVVQIGTLTVGVDDAGHDVKFFGDAASAYMLWDTSADDLILAGGAGLIVPDGQFTLGSTAVAATAAELNLLDGGTSVGSSITLADADGFVVNDGGTMKTIPATDISDYASGNLVLLHEASVTSESGGTDDYTDAAYFHATNYDRYRVYIDEFEPATDGANLELQVVLGGVLRTDNYEYHTKLFQSNSDEAVNKSAGATVFRIIDDTGNGSDESARGWFEYTSHETDNANMWPLFQWSFVSKASGATTQGGWGAGASENSSGALSGFRLLASSGGLGNYKIRIYGIKS